MTDLLRILIFAMVVPVCLAQVRENGARLEDEPRLCRLACQLDRGLAHLFRAEDRRETEPNRSVLRLSPVYATNNGGRTDRFKLESRGEIDLPLFSDWLDIRFGSTEEEEEELEDDYKTTGEARTHFWDDLSLDLRWDSGPEARLRGRLGLSRDGERTWLSADQGVSYHTDRGFGTEFRMRGLYRINEKDRLHAESKTAWEEWGRGLELQQVAGWYRDLPGFRRIGIRAIAEEFTHPSGTLDGIFLRPYARLPISDRVFLRLEPGLAWQRDEDDYETKPTVFLRLETFWGMVDDENLGKFYRRP